MSIKSHFYVLTLLAALTSILLSSSGYINTYGDTTSSLGEIIYDAEGRDIITVEISQNDELIVSQIRKSEIWDNIMNTMPILLDKDFNFYKDIVDPLYLETFLVYTQDMPEMRLMFAGLMILESANFTDYVGNTNRNGSVDYGPSQLNSKNIENPEFRKLFFPTDEELKEKLFFTNLKDPYVKYLVATINLYKAHLRMYKGDVHQTVMAYNVGPRVNKSPQGSRLRELGDIYYTKVNDNKNELLSKYNNYTNYNIINNDISLNELYAMYR